MYLLVSWICFHLLVLKTCNCPFLRYHHFSPKNHAWQDIYHGQLQNQQILGPGFRLVWDSLIIVYQVQWKRACEGFVGIDLGPTCRARCNSVIPRAQSHRRFKANGNLEILWSNLDKLQKYTYTIGLDPDLYFGKHSLVGVPSQF